jgi:hypothetical protein
MNKETVEEVAGKSATESHPICMVTVDDTTFDTNHHGMIAHFHGFIAGAEWQKQQEANNAIEFAVWTHENRWACLNNEPMWYNKSRVYQYKTECLTTQQLYELWKQTKE